MKVVGQGGLKGAGIEAASVFLLGERAVVLSAKLTELILALCHLPWSCYHGPLVVYKFIIQHVNLQTRTSNCPQTSARLWRRGTALAISNGLALYLVDRVRGILLGTV